MAARYVKLNSPWGQLTVLDDADVVIDRIPNGSRGMLIGDKDGKKEVAFGLTMALVPEWWLQED
jgi:hypothetical protein